MSLVKWMRKNNRKLIAFVTIFIMVAFVGGTAMMTLLSPKPGKDVIGHYGDGVKLQRQEYINAQKELNVLGKLGGKMFLMYKQTYYGDPDFGAALLGQLLFPDAQSAIWLDSYIKNSVFNNELPFGGKLVGTKDKVDEFFIQTGGRGELYWILLRAEARQAGCVISAEEARQVLENAIPQIIPGATAAKAVNSLMNTENVSEDWIVRVFADMLGILKYTQVITDNEEVTGDQLRGQIARANEQVSGKYIKINSGPMLKLQDDPTDAAIAEQFEKYKDVEAGQISEENPYGFGYKLPPMVTLDYIFVKDSDIEELIKKPTEIEMMEYYKNNFDQMKYEESIDPADKDSEKIVKTRNYAEASASISDAIENERVNRMAEMILTEAADIIEDGFGEIDIDEATTDEIKAAAGDYAETAAKLTEKHKLPVYTGRTGMLSMDDIDKDYILRSLSVTGANGKSVNLSRLAFAVEELGATKLSRFETNKPKMWQNIGPIGSFSGMGIVRVVATQEAMAAANMDTSFDNSGTKVIGAKNDKFYSVKSKVADDVKKLKAMAETKGRVDALKKLITEDGWDKAIASYNEQFDQRVALTDLSPSNRVSDSDIAITKIRAGYIPMRGYVSMMMRQKLMVDAFYGLVPAGETEALNIVNEIEFKPEASWYLVKEVSVTQASLQQYEKQKGLATFRADAMGADNSIVDFLLPKNITERNGFIWADTDEKKENNDDGMEADDNADSDE